MIELNAKQKELFERSRARYPQAAEYDLIELAILQTRWEDAEAWLEANGAVIEIHSDKGIMTKMIKAPHLDIAKTAFEMFQKLTEQIEEKEKKRF